MNMTNLSKTQKLTFSACIMAMYVVCLYFTQSFSFGAYQIRIATSLYALSYLFPFLVLPFGLANLIGNILSGSLGPLDAIGGFLVGVITAYLNVRIKKHNLNPLFLVLTTTFIPGLLVPIWLSWLLNMPYAPLALSLCIGQVIPAIVGFFLIKTLQSVINQAS